MGYRAMSTALRTARHRAGLSARELARRAGTSHATLLAYERGRIDPGVDTAARLIDVAGFTLELQLVPRVDVGPARDAKGRELIDALLLAEQFPTRHAPHLTAPVFGRPDR